jgi:PAS domain S-box-containing protein
MNNVKSTVFHLIKRKESFLFLVLSIACLTLLGWILNNITLTSFSSGYIPISPVTAGTFIALSILLLININSDKSRLTKSFVTFSLIIIALFYSVIFLGFLFNFKPDIENSFIKNPDGLGFNLNSSISPITPVLFLILSIGMLSIMQKNSIKLKYIGGSLSLLVCLISSILLLGYLYRAPLLYSSKIIPVSLPASICFFLFSIALIRALDWKYLTFKMISDNKFTFQLLKWLLPITIFIVILGGFIDTTFAFNDKHPALTSAIILLFVIIITVIVVIRISSVLGGELQRKEAELQESEEKFRSIMDNSADAIFIADPQGYYLYTNKAVTAMLGYTTEEMKGKSIVDLSPPERIGEYFEMFKQILSEGKVFIEFELLKKDGSLISTDLNAIVLPDGMVYGSCRNIAKRKRAEELLVKERTRYQELADSISDVFFAMDKDLKYTYWNKASVKLTGISAENAVGKSLMEIFPDNEARQHVKEMYLQVIESKKPQHFIVNYPGSINIIHEISAYPIIDGVSIFAKDITERRQAEMKLAESNQFISQILNSLQEGIIVYDSNLLHTIWNPFMEKLSGIPASQVLGKKSAEVFPFLEEAGVVNNLKSTLNGENIEAIDFPFHMADTGKSGWCSDKNMPFRDVKGEIIGVIGIVHDITERKRAELSLKESGEKLLQLNVDKDRFISILSHDLKGPFHNLLGLSEVLLEDLHKLDIDEIEVIANNINKSAKNTYNLLEDILMWAKTQQGRIPFKPQILNFRNICSEILEILNPVANTKNITINYFAGDTINIFADIDMLKTVIRNLVSNAIKYTNKRGEININAEENPKNVMITVADNGVGIAPDDLIKLFDLSQVVSTRGTAKETGTGLGLLLCKEFVEKHGGKIWVESEVGKGSCIRFTLPKSEEAILTNLMA